MLLLSWQSQCENTHGSFDECRITPGGRQPFGQANRLGQLVSLNIGSYSVHIHRRRLLPLIAKADTHFAITRRVEVLVDLLMVAGYISRWFTCSQTVTQPSINRARRRVTSLIESNALPIS